MGYYFELAAITDLEIIFDMIDARIKWMDLMNINQWNKTNYRNSYPEEYFLEAIKGGQLYILKRMDNGKIIGAVVLKREHKRWENNRPAYYICNLVTDIDEKGAGAAILEACQKLAEENRIECLRLDCASSNQKLNDYYESKGFIFVEYIIEGGYRGNKREKRL